MFHDPVEDGFEPYDPPSDYELLVASSGFRESYEDGGLEGLMRRWLEVGPPITSHEISRKTLLGLVKVAVAECHGSRLASDALRRIVDMRRS